MSPQVTFKSTEEKAPTQAGVPAPRLRDAVRSEQVRLQLGGQVP